MLKASDIEPALISCKGIKQTLVKFSILSILLCTTAPGFAQQHKQLYATDKAVIVAGQNLFQKRCASCHNFKQQGIGPDLSGVTAKRSAQWLTRFIHSPQDLAKTGDKEAVALFAKYKVPMPSNPDLDSNEMKGLLAYLNTHANVAVKPGKDSTALAFGAPLADPIPPKIQQSNLSLSLVEVMTAPASSDKIPVARINQMAVVPGLPERVFIQDLRGKLYEIRDNVMNPVMDLRELLPAFINAPGHGSGFGSYAFHPDFLNNGLFYTTHTEKKDTVSADFYYHDSIRVALQWIISEWKIDSPASGRFTGQRRELLRINMPSEIHGVQQIAFNSHATIDSADYGLLYVGVGDGGSAENGYAYLCNSNRQIRSSVLRIDPAGRNSKNHKYGIPAINPYANDDDSSTLGEVFARGFRNPNRIHWTHDGKMLISDIGLNNIEELNIGIAGADYGWPAREGTFLLNYKGRMNVVYKLPLKKSVYTNPVVQYDHDEGNAISAGFVYDGPVKALQDKYVFGDIVRGRVFYVNNADLIPGRQAVIKEFKLVFDGAASDFLSVTKNSKADMRFGIGAGKALYIYTKTDGKIWLVKDCVQAQ